MSDDLVKRSDAMQVALWFSTSELKYSRQFVKRRVMEIPTAEPKQGEWIETSEGTMCSNCHKFPYDDGEYHIANWHSDFCPNCGARMKTTDNKRDYERAIEQMQHDILYEPTYNPEDGSM